MHVANQLISSQVGHDVNVNIFMTALMTICRPVTKYNIISYDVYLKSLLSCIGSSYHPIESVVITACLVSSVLVQLSLCALESVAVTTYFL